MRIATWNVERLKHKSQINKIMTEIIRANADILVLTETDEKIFPPYLYSFSTRRD